MPDGLFEIAATEGIGVRFTNLPDPILGLYDSRPGETPMILLHEKTRQDRRLLRCILAEEVGHHFTCAQDIMAFARATPCIYNKYDQLALWWAVRYLMPYSKLRYAVNTGMYCSHELAEYFDVTERFFATGVKLYKHKQCFAAKGPT